MKNLFFALSAMSIASCASIGGAPDRSLDPGRDIVELALDQSFSDQQIKDALQAGATVDQRNAIVYARMTEIDRLYFRYERDLTREMRESGFLTTLAELAVDLSGSLAGGNSSQVLSAGSAGITGTEEAFDKEILVDRTIQALTAQMRANRDSMKARIYTELTADISSYPLIAAMTDLVAYRQAGTLTGALLGISESASEAEATARGKLVVAEELTLSFRRDAGFVAPDVRVRAGRIAATLRDSVRVSDARIVALANNPPARDSAFDDVLNPFKQGSATFTNAALARAGLVVAIQELGRSEENLSAWETALKINN